MDARKYENVTEENAFDLRKVYEEVTGADGGSINAFSRKVAWTATLIMGRPQ